MAKVRLDVALKERGLAESRQKAQAVIMAGLGSVKRQQENNTGAPGKEQDQLEGREKSPHS